MSYTTSTLYQTDDRIILDVRRLSISIWKKPRLWLWRRNGLSWFRAGPIDVFWRDAGRRYE